LDNKPPQQQGILQEKPSLDSLAAPFIASAAESNESGAETPVAVEPTKILDATRKGIAYFLLSILVGVILLQVISSTVFAVSCWANNNTCANSNAALQMIVGASGAIFTAMVGLVGSVVGFYFGSQK
jgi:lipoprotein signal peptidase